MLSRSCSGVLATFSPAESFIVASLRGLNFRQRVGDHDREIAELQDKPVVIREHRGSFLQLFYQRFQSSVKCKRQADAV